MLTLTDSDNNVTTWKYDPLGQVWQQADPNGTSSYYWYDGNGNLAQKEDNDGQVTAYTYNGLGEETAENWMSGLGSGATIVHALTYGYDPAGELTSASDSNAAYTYQYDPLGRSLTSTDNITGLTPTVVLSGQYDQSGNLSQLAAAIGGTNDFRNSYVYDNAGEMTQVSQTGNGGDVVADKLVTLSYNADGQFSTITRYADLAGNDLVVTGQYSYNGLGQLTSLNYTQGTTTLAGYTWLYDLQNEVTQETSVDGTTSYTYDPTGQLTGASSTNSLLDEGYSYDANGNRNSTGYAVGGSNQMTAGAGYSYQYDNNGNRTAQWADNNGVPESSPQEGDTDITIYTWDYRNRMTSVTTYATYDAWKGIGAYSSPTPTQTVTYAYDIFNRWLGETVTDGSGTVTENRKFVYDGNEIVLQFDSTAAGDLAAANLSHRYLYGPAVDQVLADEQVSSLSQAGNVVWPLADNLGTVRDLAVQNSGVTSIATHRVYNAFGVLESPVGAQAVDCLFGYAGGAYDSATGEENFDNRWYEAVTGRWLSQDPIGADINLYRYCHNNPVIFVDPSGLSTTNSGILFSGSLGWFSWSIEFGSISDSHGNEGTYYTTGPSEGVGGGWILRTTNGASNANTINDVNGLFVVASGNAAAGPGGGGSVAAGKAKNGKTVVCAEGGVGVGAGANAGVGVTNTTVSPSQTNGGPLQPLVQGSYSNAAAASGAVDPVTSQPDDPAMNGFTPSRRE